MSDMLYVIDELIKKLTQDNGEDHLPGITKEIADWLIEEEYPDGNEPFDRGLFLERWNMLAERERREEQKKKDAMAERVSAIRAMETLARCVNNEELFFDVWLSVGIPDGLITEDTTDDEIMVEYEDDDMFRDVLDAFLTLMCKARKDGGLYAGGVVSEQG